MDHIQYQTSKIILILLKKKHEAVADNSSMKIYVNKIEKRTTYKIKAVYYLELLTPKTIRLLGSTKSKINKDTNGKNLLHLELTEIVLVRYNIVNNGYQQDSRVFYTFFPNKSFGQLLDISPKFYIFKKLWFRIFNYQNSWGLLIKNLNHFR